VVAESGRCHTRRRVWCTGRVRYVALVVVLVLAGCGGSQPVASPPTTVVAAATTTTSTTTSTTTTTTSTTTSTTTTTTTTIPPQPEPTECVEALPVATRVGQVLLPVVDQGGLMVVADLAGRGLVAGAVIVEPVDAGLGDAIAVVQALSATGRLVMAVDEEGGTVQRLHGLLGDLPSARRMVDSPPDEVRTMVRRHAEAMAGLGFTVALAPVLDVGGGPGIGSRSFSDDPAVVATYGEAFAQGVRDAGLTPVAKHFPGHGRASVDSHEDLPVTPPIDDLRSVDLLPWESLPEEMAVMVGHLSVPGLTDGVAASLSAAAVTGLLRGDMGFTGPVMSDDLSMGAITDDMDVPEAAVTSLSAGVDLLIVGPVSNVVPVAWALVGALDDGRLSADRLNDAVRGVLALRGVDPCGLVR